MSKITEFLLNKGPDHKGRMLGQIWRYDDKQFDECHDFIQWMFPLPQSSKFFAGNDCPLLTESDVLACRFSPNSLCIQNNLITNTRQFLSFLGLELVERKLLIEKSHVRLADNFSEQSKYWLKSNDHNHLRINRMLQCLVLLGQEDLAKEIFRCLVMIKCEFSDCITYDTMVYWRNALTGYSY